MELIEKRFMINGGGYYEILFGLIRLEIQRTCEFSLATYGQ